MFISISETVSDRATKTLVLNIQEDSTIISPKEFTQRVEYFMRRGFKNSKFLQRMYELISALDTQKFYSF